MKELFFLEKISHRSRERIKSLGEVFTPESYVEDMLDILTKDRRGLWSDEEISFFEPCSGHGNIVIPIYKRRLEGIYKKVLSQGSLKATEAPFYAVANALNTLWAIDIDPKNVESCRLRVFSATLDFLKSKTNMKSDISLLSKRRNFFSHVLSAIKWHIDDNETLSSLSCTENAKGSAMLTKAGTKWFYQNGHKKMDFDLSWVKFYESCKSTNTVPLQFERSVRFIDNVISGKLKGFEDLGFAKAALDIQSLKDASKQNTSLTLEA